MSIGNRMRGLGESVYYLDDLKPKMDELMGDVSYELNHEVGKRKLLVRLDGFGEEYKPQIETLMDEELPVGYRMEYDPFPLDFIKIDFLEGVGYRGTYIDTGIVKTDAFNASLTWSQNTNTRATAWGCMYQQDSIKYGAHVQISNNRSKFGDYAVYCYRGYTIYPFPPYEGYTPLDKHTMVCNTGRKEMTIDGVTCKTGYSGSNYDLSNPQKRSIYLFGVNGWTVEPFLKIYSYSTWDDGKEKDIDFIPTIDSAGIPCMFDLVSKQPFYNQGTGQFIAGLTMKQAKKLSNLPVTNGSLTISLPKEARLVQHNSEVETALNDAASKGWNIAVQYRDAGEEDEIYKKYNECTTVVEVSAINPDYKNDLTDDGEWIYPLTNVKRFTNVGDWWNGFFSNSSIKKIKAVFPNTVYAQALFSSADKLEEIDVEFPIATQISGFIRNNSVLKKLRIVAPFVINSEYSFQWTYAKNPDIYIYFPMANRLDAMFANSPYFQEIKGEFGANATNCNSTYYKCNSLRICPSYYPKATTASDMFYGCQITAEVAINVLESFPKYTSGDHPVTMGIHIDHKDDIEVAEAIENAEAKGWTVTVQWNGTPTAQIASTFSLRKQPIYAKLGTMELSDGTAEQYLNWGHYITNWEENGYHEFASIEEAEEYFNIKTEITE